MTNHIDYQQVQYKINWYLARVKEGIELTDEELNNLHRLRRQMYHYTHKGRVEAKRVNFRNIRRCLDDGVVS